MCGKAHRLFLLVSVTCAAPLGGTPALTDHPKKQTDGTGAHPVIVPRLDAYGDPLPAGALLRLGTVRLRHGAAVNSLCFSPDGTTLASASIDKTVRLWDTASGKEIRRFVGQDQAVDSVVFTPDGKTLVSARSADKTFRFWQVESGRPILQVLGGGAGGEAGRVVLAVRPDGKAIASCDKAGNEVSIWEQSSGRTLLNLHGYDNGRGLAFTPDGKVLGIASQKGIHLLDVNSKEARALAAGEAQQGVAVFFLPDGKAVVSGSILSREVPARHQKEKVALPPREVAREAVVRVHDVATGAEPSRWQWPVHEPDEFQLAMSPDGKRLAATMNNNSVLVWERETGKIVRRVKTEQRDLSGLALSPDGKMLAGAEGTAIRLWDLSTGKELNPEAHRGTVSFKLSPTGRALATTADGREIHVWELPTGKRLTTLAATQGAVSLIGFTPEGEKLFWASKQADEESDHGRALTTFHVWCVSARKEVLRWQVPEFVDEAQLSRDGRLLATTGSMLRLWDAHTGHARHAANDWQQRGLHVAFSWDSKVLAAVRPDLLCWWDTASGKELGRIDTNWPKDDELLILFPAARQVLVVHADATDLWDLSRKEKIWRVTLGDQDRPRSFHALSFSPAAKMLSASPPLEGLVRLWHMPSGQFVRDIVLKGWFDGAYTRFSRDGRAMLIFGHHVQLMETATGQLRQRFTGHQRTITSAILSPDGTFLVSSSADTTVLLWDLSGRLTLTDPPGRDLGKKQLDELWHDLASTDAGQAFRAMQRLSASGRQALSLFSTHLRPFATPDRERIAGLQRLVRPAFIACRDPVARSTP